MTMLGGGGGGGGGGPKIISFQYKMIVIPGQG